MARFANALLTNSVQVGALGIGNLVPHVQAGKFKVLAVDSATRSPLLPDAPTLKELGLAHTRIKTWYGFLAPIATPPAVIEKLHKAINEAAKSPDVIEKLGKQGVIAEGSSSEVFAKMIDDETKKWGDVIRATGIKLDQ